MAPILNHFATNLLNVQTPTLFQVTTLIVQYKLQQGKWSALRTVALYFALLSLATLSHPLLNGTIWRVCKLSSVAPAIARQVYATSQPVRGSAHITLVYKPATRRSIRTR